MLNNRRHIAIILIVALTSVFLFSCGISTPFSFSYINIEQPTLPQSEYSEFTDTYVQISRNDEAEINVLGLRLIYDVKTADILSDYVTTVNNNIRNDYWNEKYYNTQEIIYPTQTLESFTESTTGEYLFDHLYNNSNINDKPDYVLDLLAGDSRFSSLTVPLNIDASELPVIKVNGNEFKIADKFKDISENGTDTDQYIYLYGYITARGLKSYISPLFLIGIYKYPATTE